MTNIKLLVIGHAQHGKDTVSEMLCERYGLNCVSSSYFAMERTVRDSLAAQGITYSSAEGCFEDRKNHRQAWASAIAEYNREDPTKLGREILAQYDIYTGLRSLREFVALHNARAFDVCLWVDRSTKVASEPRTSMTLGANLADFVLDNNGELDDLPFQVEWAWESALRLAAQRRVVGHNGGG